MKSYVRTRNHLTIFLLFITAVGYLTLLRPPSYEVYPFYSWTMFALVPGKEVDYQVFLLEVNGKKLGAPRVFQKADGMVRGQSSPTAYKNIQRLGQALEKGTPEEVKAAREHFESNHLEFQTRYDVVRRVSDPLDRWHNNQKPAEQESLQVYQSES